MATDLERLTVLIEANTRQYARSMRQMQIDTAKAIRGSTKSIKGLDGALASATRTAKTLAGAFGVSLGVGALKQFASALTDTVQQADDLQDLADKIGITAENLQELQYQAKVTGSNTEDMNAALDQFTKRIGEAASGSGALLKILKDHNIELRDQAGQLRPITDLLNDYAELMRTATSDAERLALAQAAFKNTDMASVFRNGAAGIREMGDEAHRTSQVISNETIKALADIQPELDRLEGAWSVAWANITLLTLNALTKIGQAEHFILDPIIAALDKIKSGAGTIEGAKSAGAAAGRRMGRTAPTDPNANSRINDAFGSPAPSSSPAFTPYDFSILEKRFNSYTGSINQNTAARIRVTDAIGAETESLSEQNIVLVRNDEAQQKIIDTLDTLRDSTGSALDAFAQSIQAGEGPVKALKAALLDLLQTIIRIGEQRAILAMFGAAGTAGGGFFGAAVQKVAVQVTASPLFHATVEKGARQAEERAVARGPAVARSNNLRYATP
jgi:hypothetical protein